MQTKGVCTQCAPLFVTMKYEDGDDGYDLRNGLVLAVTFRREDDVFRCGQQAQTGNCQFAGDDNDDHPGGDPIETNKRDKSRANHDLVGERVHQNTEVSDELLAARALTVEK